MARPVAAEKSGANFCASITALSRWGRRGSTGAESSLRIKPFERQTVGVGSHGRRPVWLDATELARLVAAGERSPVEVVQAHLERIEAVGKDFNGGILLGKTNLPEMSY
jgi:hypothetical protein